MNEIKIKIQREKLLVYWVNEKNGYGMKNNQFRLGLKKTQVSRALRQLRKEKKIYIKSKRWCMKTEVYKELKNSYSGEEGQSTK